ncbi:hypothetical protein Tco_1448494 [Tanacetum coccineum]
MDNPNLTMEEYVRLEEEKTCKHVKVFDWQTATYEKIRVDDSFYDLRSMEAEFPAIIINDDFAPKDTLQCKSQVSIPVNDEINFRISFDESDDEDYTIICDKNSFSYKMISLNNLKTDSENDYEEVMPSISCFDNLDFFKDFENEFPAIIYNDAQMSKSDLLTEPILNPLLGSSRGYVNFLVFDEYEKKSIRMVHLVKGTTTMAFIFEGGVMVAVASHKLDGMLYLLIIIATFLLLTFSSQTLKKAVRRGDFQLAQQLPKSGAESHLSIGTQFTAVEHLAAIGVTELLENSALRCTTYRLHSLVTNPLSRTSTRFAIGSEKFQGLALLPCDQLHAYLQHHERHENEVRLMHCTHFDPLALVASHN